MQISDAFLEHLARKTISVTTAEGYFKKLSLPLEKILYPAEMVSRNTALILLGVFYITKGK